MTPKPLKLAIALAGVVPQMACAAVGASPVLAQSVSLDGTLGRSGGLQGPEYVVPQEAGRTIGGNLFHSFGRLSLQRGEVLRFESSPGVRNIISRVTGGVPSSINGLIQSQISGVNLFLINPSGIVFGPQARLDVNGSFVASTASEVQFANLGSFSALAPARPSDLLTVNPSALRFSQRLSQPITVNARRAELTNPMVLDVDGLSVRQGRSLLLLGGAITLDGGGLKAPSGTLEIAGVAGNQTVPLNWEGDRPNLRLPPQIALANVTLTHQANVNISGPLGGGRLQIIGHDVWLNDAEVSANGAPLDVLLSARGNLLAVNSRIYSGYEAAVGGNVEVNGGNITLQDTQIFSSAFGNRESGAIALNAVEHLSLSESTLDSSTDNGRGGDMRLYAGRAIHLWETNLNGNTMNGTGSNIDLRTPGTLVIRTSDSGSGVVATQVRGRGGAGSIALEGGQGVFLDGAQLLSNAQNQGKAGLIVLQTSDLRLSNGARIDVQNQGTQPGGNIIVQSNQLVMGDRSNISATTSSSEGGNINLTIRNLLLLRQASAITTAAGINNSAGTGNGGNVRINAALVVGLPDQSNEITTRAFRGNGGNITIRTQGLSGFEQKRSTPGDRTNVIDASSRFGLSGTVQILTPDTDPSQGLTSLPVEVTDPANQIARTCPTAGNTARSPSQFMIPGRGGLPIAPTDPLTATAATARWVAFAPGRPGAGVALPTLVEPLREAQGWVRKVDGTVQLIAPESGTERLRADGAIAPTPSVQGEDRNISPSRACNQIKSQF